MSGGFRAAGAVFAVAGAAILSVTRQPFSVWLSSVGSMTNIVAIVAIMLTFVIPIRIGVYDDAIRSWIIRYFRGERALYLLSMATTHVLGSFSSFGCVPVSFAVFEKALKGSVRDYPRFISTAVSRGYVLAALWAPGAINLYLVAQSTGIPWPAIFLPGFILALAGMGLSLLLECVPGGVTYPRVDKPQALDKGAENISEDEERLKIVHILIVVVVFIVLVLLFDRLRIGAPYNRIILAGLLITTTWTLFLSRGEKFKESNAGSGPWKENSDAVETKVVLREYWEKDILKIVDVGPFFVAMGVFSSSLEHSGLMDFLAPVLNASSGFLGPWTLVAASLLIALFSIVGVHPYITIVLLGNMLARAELPIPMLTIALALAVGGAASYMISPFAGVIMTVSRFTGVKASDIALRWNWKYSLSFLTLGMLFSYVWGGLFG